MELGKLTYQFADDNPRVKKLKEKILETFFDIINSWELNNTEGNFELFDCLKQDLKELDEAIKSVYEANKSRENINLQELITERNKLNRRISTLKKATFNK